MVGITATLSEPVPVHSTIVDSATVYIVDDDRDMCESLAWILKGAGYHFVACNSAKEAISSCNADQHGCLLIDLRLRDLDGFELRDILLSNQCRQPFIMMSAYGDIALAVKAIRRGAVDFLEKPFNRSRLLESVGTAVRRDRRRRDVQRRLDSLTDREREVLALVASGKATKEIARILEISARTVESHRSRITKKMQVDSVPELVYMLSKHEQLDV
jgi:RNA polymerase sigma factor (sigma-70 family)